MSYVDEKTPEAGRVYDVLGLTAALRVKGHMLPWYVLVAMVGDGGLGSRMVRDLSAEMADVWL